MFAIAKTAAAKGLSDTETQPNPTLAPHEVRVDVSHAGICGTDMHIYQWDAWASGRVKVPTVLGHEFVGRIVELGTQVTGFKIGQRVSAECHVVCGVCRWCRTGRGHLCPDTQILGVDRNGAFADEVAVPASNLWPVPDEIPDHHAAIFDPLGNAMHTVMAFPIAGRDVVISGAGPIGLMAVAMARANGAGRIVVLEPNEAKRKLAIELGATHALEPTSDIIEVLKTSLPHMPDLVLEMSGHPKALATALDLLPPGGQMALLGIPAQAVSIDLAKTVIFKGLTLHGIIGRKMYETWYQVEQFLRLHPEKVEKIISHVLPAHAYAKAFTLMEQGQANKIVLDFTTND